MKERIKSVVLVILVIMNFILGSRVLSTKKLWSDSGYNFFSDMRNNPLTGILRSIKDKISNKPPAETHIEEPELIIVNTGYQTSRVALNRTDEEFAQLSAVLDEFLTDAFSTPQRFTAAKVEDLYSALTAKSVYLHYPVSYDSALFSYLLGITSADFSQSFSQLCDIVVASDGSVFVQDSLTDKVYRCVTSVPVVSLNRIIDSHIAPEYSANLPVINYAFDLGFDKAFGTQKTVLSPMIPIYSGDIELDCIYAKNPILKSDMSVSESCISDILQVFSMNPNVLRRYTDADGAIVFVENNSTLKISSNGLISYSATDGVLLSKNSVDVQLGAVAAVAGFVDKVNKAAGSDSAMRPSSNITASELGSGALEVSFDYLANGRLVKLDNDNFDNAVTVEIENGRIKSYRQLLRAYSKSGEKTVIPNYIYAIDDTIALYEEQMNDIEINALVTAYSDDCTDGIKVPFWNVEVNRIIIE